MASPTQLDLSSALTADARDMSGADAFAARGDMGTVATPPPYISLPPLTSHDPTKMTGEDTFAARCAMAPTSSFIAYPPPVAIKHEDRSELGMPGVERPNQVPDNYIKCEPLEECEVWDSTRSMSQATKFLDSIRPSVADHHSLAELPPRPYPNQSHMSPYSLAYTRSLSASASGDNDRISGLDHDDLLDRSIGIKPRNKQSDELQTILSPQWQNKMWKQRVLPGRMQRITKQFMVANRFVAQRAYLEKSKRRKLWKSLRLRLDLHGQNNSIAVKHIPRKRLDKCLAVAVQAVDTFIITESKQWKKRGIFQQRSENSAPEFDACTRGWVSPAWNDRTSTDGSLIDALLGDLAGLSSANLQLVMDQAHRELANRGYLPQPPGPVYLSRDTPPNARQALGQLTSSAANALSMVPGAEDSDNADLERKYIVGSALTCGKPVYSNTDDQEPVRMSEPHPGEKHSADEYLESFASKRPRIEPSKADFPSDNLAMLESPVRYERELGRIIDSIHLAHGFSADSGPSTAKDFASLQRDWADHGYGSCLVSALKVGQSYASAITKYFDTAIELLSVLGDSDRWRLDSEGLEVDCACQRRRLYSPSQPSWEGATPEHTGQ